MPQPQRVRTRKGRILYANVKEINSKGVLKTRPGENKKAERALSRLQRLHGTEILSRLFHGIPASRWSRMERTRKVKQYLKEIRFRKDARVLSAMPETAGIDWVQLFKRLHPSWSSKKIRNAALEMLHDKRRI